MQWFDIGVNLLDERFNVTDVIARAKDKQVRQMCVISSNIDEALAAQILVENQNSAVSFQNLVYTAGVHPHYADNFSPQAIVKLNQLAADKNMVAVGECGLDFNRNFSSKNNQLKAFEAQLKFAAECQKPVYLHERDAFDDQVRLLREYLPYISGAIAHCFTGTRAQMETYLELGCYIGITGWLCDEKRGKELREAVKSLPMGRLLLETDAPYLFPKNVQPRLKTNEPYFLPDIAQKIAQIMHKDLRQISEASVANTYSIFGLQKIDGAT